MGWSASRTTIVASSSSGSFELVVIASSSARTVSAGAASGGPADRGADAVEAEPSAVVRAAVEHAVGDEQEPLAGDEAATVDLERAVGVAESEAVVRGAAEF